MPGRNIYKQYAPDTYYHVYNRGVDKQAIFRDDDDYAAFLHLLKRYLDPTDRSERTANSRPYPCYDQDITLHAYCLMPNHFHMLMYQITDNGMRQLMKSVTVAYSMYFNKKYKRVGPLFQQRYRAVRMLNEAQFLHSTRYIHLNPDSYKSYEWSSYEYYTGARRSAWLKPDPILDCFSSQKQYLEFVEDYTEKRAELAQLKAELSL